MTDIRERAVVRGWAAINADGTIESFADQEQDIEQFKRVWESRGLIIIPAEIHKLSPAPATNEDG